MSKFPFITPDDILPYVNNELASLGIGASVGTLHLNKNTIHCTSKKYKGSIVVFVNEDKQRAGSVSGFCITSLKDNGTIKISKAVRDILGTDNRKLPSRSYEDIEKARQKAEFDLEVQKRNSERALQKVLAEYRRASENGVCAYFQRKNVKPYAGVRFNRDIALIPLCGYEGGQLKIRSVQRITVDSKDNATGLTYSKLFFPIGNRQNPSNIYFCEGYATASTIYESISNKNNSLVVMCVNSTNLPKVVDIFVEKYNDVYQAGGFTVCADNDMWKEPRSKCFAGFKSAATVATKWDNVLITYPLFSHDLLDIYQKYSPDPTKKFEPTDFNDQAFFDTADVESVRFSAHEFLTQVYDIKNNSVVDDNKQLELFAKKSDQHQNRKFAKYMSELLKNDIVLPVVQISRSDRDAERDAEILRIRNQKQAIDIDTKRACAISDQQGGTKKAQSKRRAEIRAIGNAKKRDLTLKPVEKYRVIDTPIDIDADKNAIACYFKPFRDVELGIANGKFSQITSKYVDIPQIRNGATELLYCGMGAGKTRNFINQAINLVKEILHTENRIAKILVLSPRVALVNKLVLDLNAELAQFKEERSHARDWFSQHTHDYIENWFLQFYSYDTLKSGGVDGQKIKANLLVSTVHSAKFFDTDDFDLVIADEFHQSRQCFQQGMENAVANFDSLNSTIKTARRFIATGADLTQKDIDFIENLRGSSHVWYQLPEKNNKHLTLYADKKNLDRAGYEAIQSGQRLMIASNSKAYIRSRAKLLDKLGISNLAIYDDVTGEKDVSRFLDDPNGELEKYQVVLYSPVITSGLSFDALPSRKDRLVFGYFTSFVGSAGDAWQMGGRFRGSDTKYHICLDAPAIDAGMNALQKAQTQLKRLMQQAKNDPYKFKSLLANNPIQKREHLIGLIESDSFDNVFSDFDKFIFDLQDENIAAQRDYFQDFITQMVAQKIDFSLANVQSVDKELSEAIKDAVDTVKTEDIQHIVDCNASPIDEKQHDVIKNKSRVTSNESDKSKHFDFRTFLATTELTERDAAFMLKRGKSKISAIERANSELDELHMQQAIDELENAPISLARLKINSTEFVRKLLEVVGLNNFENGKIQPSEKWHEWGGQININSPNVQRFLSWVWDNRSWINGLNIADLRSVKEGFNTDMQWLNTALAAVGVKMERYDRVTVGKFRINKYRVDLENLAYLNEVLARRFKQIHVLKLKSTDEID